MGLAAAMGRERAEQAAWLALAAVAGGDGGAIIRSARSGAPARWRRGARPRHCVPRDGCGRRLPDGRAGTHGADSGSCPSPVVVRLRRERARPARLEICAAPIRACALAACCCI